MLTAATKRVTGVLKNSFNFVRYDLVINTARRTSFPTTGKLQTFYFTVTIQQVLYWHYIVQGSTHLYTTIKSIAFPMIIFNQLTVKTANKLQPNR